MLKLRNLLIIYAVLWVISIFVCIWLEFNHVERSSERIYQYMRIAADISLKQATDIDEFFGTGDGEGPSMISYSEVGGFSSKSLYNSLWGITGKGEVFKKMYTGLTGTKDVEFKAWLNKVKKIKFDTYYYTAKDNITSYVPIEVPKVYAMGKPVVGDLLALDVIAKSGSLAGSSLPTAVVPSFEKDFRFDKSEQNYIDDFNQPKTYYNVPTRLNLTYLDRDVLSALFTNNVEMLMRFKYKDNGSYSGSEGVCSHSFYPDKDTVLAADPKTVSPINDGMVTFIRGGKIGDLHKGIHGVQVEYKVIDLYNPLNKPLAKYLFPSTDGFVSGVGALGKENVDLSGSVETQSKIVVVKVTFKCDFYIHYTTPYFRNLTKNGVVGGTIKTFTYSKFFTITY